MQMQWYISPILITLSLPREGANLNFQSSRENIRLISILRARSTPDGEGADGPGEGHLQVFERLQQPHEQRTKHVRQQEEEVC